MESSKASLIRSLSEGKSYKNTNQEWIVAVYDSIAGELERGTKEFSSQEIREAVESRGIKTENSAIIANIFQHLLKEGIIEKAGIKMIRSKPNIIWAFTNITSSEPEPKSFPESEEVVEISEVSLEEVSIDKPKRSKRAKGKAEPTPIDSISKEVGRQAADKVKLYFKLGNFLEETIEDVSKWAFLQGVEFAESRINA